MVLPYTRRASLAASCWSWTALGETMAVTFVIGNAYNISAQLFEPATPSHRRWPNEFNEALIQHTFVGADHPWPDAVRSVIHRPRSDRA